MILGTAAGLHFVDRAGALAAVLLTTAGEALALPNSIRWLAA